jgi:hypothetical protein
MKGKLQEYALIAEIIGGIAIVASLIFVGFQVQQSADETALNTRQMQTNAFQELQYQMAQMHKLDATDPELLKIRKKRYSGQQLDDVEINSLRLINRIRFRHGDTAYFQYENGFITEEQLIIILGPMRGSLLSEDDYPRNDWENYVAVSEAFRDYMNSFMRQMGENQ